MPNQNIINLLQTPNPKPQTPIDPITGNPVTGSDAYQGQASNYSHVPYTDPDGEILLFRVDDGVYDKNGYLIDNLFTGSQSYRPGWSDKIILPMGNDCRRYAILFRDKTSAGSYTSTSSKKSIFMAVYDMNGVPLSIP